MSPENTGNNADNVETRCAMADKDRVKTGVFRLQTDEALLVEAAAHHVSPFSQTTTISPLVVSRDEGLTSARSPSLIPAPRMASPSTFSMKRAPFILPK